MMAFRTFFGQVHLWLGLFSGLVVFILGLTGCIMAYQEELQNWMYSNKLKVEAATFNEPMALSRLH
ncbi:MAG: PepSY-associated TM helix domain-containing protein, partial [Bacteroidota bacterium]